FRRATMRDLLRQINARDVHFYAGGGLVAAGLYYVYPPLALIAPGAVFLYVSLRRVQRMGILDSIEQRHTPLNSALKSAPDWLADALGGAPAPVGVRVTPEKALGITAFWNGVRIISQTIASLPLEVYERMDDGSRRLAREHPVYRLLHVRPNPYMT